MLIYADEPLYGINEKVDAIVFDRAHERGFYPKPRQTAARTYVERTSKLN